MNRHNYPNHIPSPLDTPASETNTFIIEKMNSGFLVSCNGVRCAFEYESVDKIIAFMIEPKGFKDQVQSLSAGQHIVIQITR